MAPADDHLVKTPTQPAARGVFFDDIVDVLDTGDLLVFHGESRLSLEVELATGSPLSHCAMVIRHPKRPTPMIWQAGPGAIVTDPELKTKHGGAQLGDLREALVYMQSPEFHDTGYVRQLNFDRPAGFDDHVMKIIAELDGRPFPSMLEMLENFELGKVFHVVTPEKTLFCAELVALTYMRLGLLPPSPPANAYAPGTFDATNPSLPLTEGARLGAQIRIERPTPA